MDGAQQSGAGTKPQLEACQELLKQAFKLYPRVVLSCCLQSFKGQDRAMFQASRPFKHGCAVCCC